MALRYAQLLLYLDILPDPSKPGSLDILHDSRVKEGESDTAMVFLKHFDAAKQTLFGVGKLCVPRAKKVGNLISIINERMKWGPSTPLKIYEVMSVAHFYQSDVPIYCPSAGNQTRHDRAHEAKAHAPPE